MESEWVEGGGRDSKEMLMYWRANREKGDGGKTGELPQKTIVAKALDGQRYPMPLCTPSLNRIDKC